MSRASVWDEADLLDDAGPRYVERSFPEHDETHDAWDGGGYCNALVDESGGTCGYRRRDDFEQIVAWQVETGPMVEVFAPPSGRPIPIREEPEPLLVTAAPGSIAVQIGCRECFGSGWWGYGPVAETCGPCVDCKGTGRVWVGL